MEEEYYEYKQKLLSDYSFKRRIDFAYNETGSKTKRLIEATSIITKLTLPSFVIGFCIANADPDSFLLSAIFFVIISAMLFIMYMFTQKFYDKIGEDIFYHYAFKQIIKDVIRDEEKKLSKETVSDLTGLVLESSCLITDIRYRKTIPKSDWDKLYESIKSAEKICRQYDMNLFSSFIERRLLEDYGFYLNAIEKHKEK